MPHCLLFVSIFLTFLFSSRERQCETLDYGVKIQGLTTVGNPVFINLLIDAGRRPHSPQSSDEPSVKNLLSFSGTSGVINVVEEIGSNYYEFGVLLLNDSGNYIRALERQYNNNCTAIVSEIVRVWNEGRRNAKPCEWRHLIETLLEIQLTNLADKIQSSL